MHVPLVLVGTTRHAPNSFPLPPGPTYKLGRSSRCHIVARHRTVSRRHASILVADSFLKVVDLGSCNGTYVDDRRIEYAEIRIGQRLRLGAVEFVLTAAEPRSGDCLDSFEDTDHSGMGHNQESEVVACQRSRLTPARETVLQLLLAGLSEKAIAIRLDLEKCTVHNHVMEIYRFFEVHSRAELLALHLKNGNGNGKTAAKRSPFRTRIGD